jgi:hypothetical protein
LIGGQFKLPPFKCVFYSIIIIFSIFVGEITLK